MLKIKIVLTIRVVTIINKVVLLKIRFKVLKTEYIRIDENVKLVTRKKINT